MFGSSDYTAARRVGAARPAETTAQAGQVDGWAKQSTIPSPRHPAIYGWGKEQSQPTDAVQGVIIIGL